MSNDPKDTRLNFRITKSWKERFEAFTAQINELLEEGLTLSSMIKNIAWFQRLLWMKSPYVSERSYHILLIRKREYIYYKTEDLLLNVNFDHLSYIPMNVSMKTNIVRRVRAEEHNSTDTNALINSIKNKWKLNHFWLYDREDGHLVDHATDEDGLTYKYVELKTHPRMGDKLRRESLVVLDLYGKEAQSRDEWSYDVSSFETEIPSKNMHILVVFEGDRLEKGGKELIFEATNREGVGFKDGGKRLLMDDVDFDYPKKVRTTKVKKNLGETLPKKSLLYRDFIQPNNEHLKRINQLLQQYGHIPFSEDINDENLVFYGLKIPMPPTDLMFRLKWPTPLAPKTS